MTVPNDGLFISLLIKKFKKDKLKNVQRIMNVIKVRQYVYAPLIAKVALEYNLNKNNLHAELFLY